MNSFFGVIDQLSDVGVIFTSIGEDIASIGQSLVDAFNFIITELQKIGNVLSVDLSNVGKDIAGFFGFGGGSGSSSGGNNTSQTIANTQLDIFVKDINGATIGTTKTHPWSRQPNTSNNPVEIIMDWLS